MTDRTILVVGATGKQGSALIRAGVSSASEHDFHFAALTRNASSPSAQALTKLGERVSIVTADLDKEETVKKVFEDAKESGGIWGVYVALAFPGLGVDASGEEKQGKMLADLALEYDVKHFIYSSACRGHESRDDEMKLSGRAKVNIERHIKSLEGLSWTILQPTFFMENFEGYIGKICISVLRVGMKKDTKIQLIAAEDIGYVGFAVMRSPEAYRGKTITVIGDALTTTEVQDSYKRGSGKTMPSVANIFARGLLAMNTHTREVCQSQEDVHADRVEHNVVYADLISECRAVYPGMQTFEAWAKHRELGEGAEGEGGGWNKVSLKDLLAGKL